MKISIDDDWSARSARVYAREVCDRSGLKDMDRFQHTEAERLFGYTAAVLANAGEVPFLGRGGAYSSVDLGRIVTVVSLAAKMLGDHHRRRNAV